MSIIFALDDAVLNEMNIVLYEELSPENTSLDTINHIVLKINEVVKNSGLHGLTRVCTETICVWFTAECEKKRGFYVEQESTYALTKCTHQ